VNHHGRTRFVVLCQLLLLYLVCWITFVGMATSVASRGGAVSTEAALIAPVLPLRLAGVAFAESEVLAALGYVVWSLLPLALCVMAVAKPAHLSWLLAACSGVVAQWLLFFIAMAVGA